MTLVDKVYDAKLNAWVERGQAVKIKNTDANGNPQVEVQDAQKEQGEVYVPSNAVPEDELRSPIAQELTDVANELLFKQGRMSMLAREMRIASAEEDMNFASFVQAIRLKIDEEVEKDPNADSYKQLNDKVKAKLKQEYGITPSLLEKISALTDIDLQKMIERAQERHVWAQFFRDVAFEQLLADIKAIKESISASKSET